jgi:cation transport ATPase
MNGLTNFLLYFSICAALVTMPTTHKVESALAIVLVAYVCSSPIWVRLSAAGALAQIAGRGLLIREEKTLEVLAKIQAVVIDGDASFLNSFASQQRLCGFTDLKIATLLFTGELENIAQKKGETLGVDFVEAELFPEDKPCKLAAVRKRYGTVLMIGGGENDESALLQAHIGVVIGSPDTAAKNVGLVRWFRNDLHQFAATIAIARRARRLAIVNMTLRIVLTLLAIGIGIFGEFSLLWAAGFLAASQLTFFITEIQFRPSRAEPMPHG